MRVGDLHEEPFATITGVESELDDSPVMPDERKLWNAESLAREEAAGGMAAAGQRTRLGGLRCDPLAVRGSRVRCVITATPDSDDLWAEFETAHEYFAAVSLGRDGRFVLTCFKGTQHAMLPVDLADFRVVVDQECRRLAEMYTERSPRR